MSIILFISSNFFPVNFIFSIFVTTTKSPLSIFGVYLRVLFFPLKTRDIKAANLPTIARFSASMIIQLLMNFVFFYKISHYNMRINSEI